MLNILVISNDNNTVQCCHTGIRSILSKCFIHLAHTEDQVLRSISDHAFDLFLIDIQLSPISGIRLAEKIRKDFKYVFTNILFITDEQQNALFLNNDQRRYDFIEKPLNLTSFQDSLGLMLMSLNNMKIQNQSNCVSEKQEFVLIETKNSTKYIPHSKILFVESEGRGIKLVTKNTLYSGVKLHLEGFLEMANSASFCRCHKSYVVNLSNMTGLKTVARRLWIAEFALPSPHDCYISRTFYDDVMDLLKCQ